ncbi:unnamed protein product [Leptosia nina]|uniref:Uncharacterized protein n=1 Tax=Leptosia nina TaxID=320188 RepID=A0AAV1J9W9_9NEOP
MDTKGEGEEMTYPHICFMVDNFDEVFCDIVVRDGEMVCVELVARGRGEATQAVIFLGSIRYDALTRVYDARQSSLSTKVAQRMSFGLLGARGAGATRCEFVRMKGPGGKGHAEVAVSRPRGSGVHTPSSEPGLTAAELWDSDWEDDPDDMFLYRHQRRLSDPSANIASFVRGGWRSRDKEKDARDKSRSENEGLDSLNDGLAEVEAGDLRDGRRGSGSTKWCCARPSKRVEAMREVYRAAPPAPLSPACLHHLSPRRPPHSPAPSLRPLHNAQAAHECEIAYDVASLDENDLVATISRVRPTQATDKDRTVRGREELPCDVNDNPRRHRGGSSWADTDQERKSSRGVSWNGSEYRKTETSTATKACRGVSWDDNVVRKTENKNNILKPKNRDCEGDGGRYERDDERETCSESGARDKGPWSGSARAYVTLPRRRGVAAALFRSARLPPRRTTPDGTDIYYWCDLPKRNIHELDDGAYNPLWALRGFTQTFHLWKEGKRQQSAPLSAFLTYVTLPWWAIAKDILDHREEPILTF